MTEPAGYWEGGWKHPAHGDGELYTPTTVALLRTIWHTGKVHGTWRQVSRLSGIPTRELRMMRRVRRKAISMTVLDRLFSATGVGDLNDYPWFTPEDLVALGIWAPTIYVEGRKRYAGNDAVLKMNKLIEENTSDHRRTVKEDNDQ